MDELQTRQSTDAHASQSTKTARWRFVRLTVALLLCITALACKMWLPDTANALRPWIVGSDDNRLAAAFADLTSSMEGGESVGQAVEAFYTEVKTGIAAP